LSSKDPDAEFNKDSAVTKLGEGIYSGYVQPRWSVVVHPNGGYLTSMIISAMRGELTHRDPLTVTAHFLSPTVHDAPCEIRVEVVKQSKRMETVTAVMVQEHKGKDGQIAVRERMRVIASFGKLKIAGEEESEPWHINAVMPGIPPPDECTSGIQFLRGKVPLADRTDMLVDPQSSWATRMCQGKNGPGGEPEYTCWVRFKDGRDPCLRAMAYFNDGLPPPVLNCVEGLPWVPTMELTTHFLQRPNKDLCKDRWMLLNYKCDVLVGGRLIGETTLWDTEGNLLSQSRQMAMLVQDPRMQGDKKTE
jgi:acyl-CoA thioesterase